MSSKSESNTNKTPNWPFIGEQFSLPPTLAWERNNRLSFSEPPRKVSPDLTGQVLQLHSHSLNGLAYSQVVAYVLRNVGKPPPVSSSEIPSA